MNKYFNESHEWTEKDIKYTGLPRPFKNFDYKYYKKISSKIKLAKKFPIPWQSKPVFNNMDDSVVFNVILENENRVPLESLCGYCGIKINDDEFCVRWDDKIYFTESKRDRVKSDYYPLHIECMKQARVFCPFMKKVEEKDFEYGVFKKIKNNSDNLVNNILKVMDIF